jgi:hypothetical protein
MASASDSIVYKLSALSYFLMFGMVFLVMQLKAYRLSTLKDVGFKEFLSANDHQFFGRLKIGKKQLIAIFEERGQGDYARSFFKKTRKS